MALPAVTTGSDETRPLIPATKGRMGGRTVERVPAQKSGMSTKRKMLLVAWAITSFLLYAGSFAAFIVLSLQLGLPGALAGFVLMSGAAGLSAWLYPSKD